MYRVIIKSRYVLNIILALVLFYFIYHTVVGQRGGYAYFQLHNLLISKKMQLQELVTERQFLEKRVKLLDPAAVDIDFLDELARKESGLIGSEEKCFILSHSLNAVKRGK